MTARAELYLHVFAPALTRDDGRPLAAVEGMEQAVPGLRLAWRLSDAGRPVALAQRGVWLEGADAATGRAWPAYGVAAGAGCALEGRQQSA
ncbi:DUF5953 family protein [Archangium gephyra]|uniref:DUF5953 family protein n=1 Tax=Archangium gephyra TaxID=48 RepID=UPI0035D41E5A